MFAMPARFCVDGIQNGSSVTQTARSARRSLNRSKSPAQRVSLESTFEPGERVTVYGNGFSEAMLNGRNRNLPPDHVRVWCNGAEASLEFITPTSVTVILPNQCYKGPLGPTITNRLIIARSNNFGEINPADVHIAAEGFTLLPAAKNNGVP